MKRRENNTAPRNAVIQVNEQPQLCGGDKRASYPHPTNKKGNCAQRALARVKMAQAGTKFTSPVSAGALLSFQLLPVLTVNNDNKNWILLKKIILWMNLYFKYIFRNIKIQRIKIH